MTTIVYGTHHDYCHVDERTSKRDLRQYYVVFVCASGRLAWRQWWFLNVSFECGRKWFLRESVCFCIQNYKYARAKMFGLGYRLGVWFGGWNTHSPTLTPPFGFDTFWHFRCLLVNTLHHSLVHHFTFLIHSLFQC